MRTIKKIHKAVYEPIADLVTYRALPTASVPYIDPFLFLNHHGPQVYPPNNSGLPFGPHPHRGFETVTFVLEGDIFHRDSGGSTGVIHPGGIQWMTAGRGLIHEEISSDTFKKEGGPLEILQLWLNLPAKYKLTAPAYRDLQREDIPVYTQEDGNVAVQVIAGDWNGIRGACTPLTDVHLQLISMKAGGSFRQTIAPERNIFFYVISGALTVNGQAVEALRLVAFAQQGTEIRVTADADARILYGHALPFGEPVVAQGPFVMNSNDEIITAYNDYRSGKFGSWNH